MQHNEIKLSPNPYKKANIFSKLCFTWTIPFFKKPYKHDLELTDVYEIVNSDKSEVLGNRLETIWNRKRVRSKNNSLLTAITQTFWKEYALLALLLFSSEIVVRLGQPFLLSYLLRYFEDSPRITHSSAIGFAGGIVLLSAINALLYSKTYHVAFHNGLKVRVAVCSLIYRKSLRLSQTALDEVSAGNVVNLLSNDVNHFDWASFFVNTMWVGPLFAIMVAILMCYLVGFVILIGILVVFIAVPILGYSGKLISMYHLQTSLRTDERIRFMDEIVTAVQAIKMYAWEKPFAELVALTRQMELKAIRKMYNVKFLHMISTVVTNRLALFFTMLGMVYINGPEQIIANQIFVMSTYFSIVSQLMANRFPRGIAETAEVLSSLERIQTFLVMDEKEREPEKHQNPIPNYIVDGSWVETIENKSIFCISMENVTARWATPSNENTIYAISKRSRNNNRSENHANNEAPNIHTLSNLTINFPRGRLIGVIGRVGAGKSSLLQALLRELPIESGSITINGSISYASQEPWVFAASVRQNILFGDEFDYSRYDAVIRMCALTKDFAQFPHGDLTIVCERGASLSGGQRARVNLARACYRDADIYLLDDPLSAVDAHVGTHIFEKCIGPNGGLARRGSTRILVTHQIHFLKEADWLVVLKDGKIEIQGTPDDIQNNHIDELIGVVETPEDKEAREKLDRQKLERLSRRSAIFLSTDDLEFVKIDPVLLSRDELEFGKLAKSNSKDVGDGMQKEATSKGIIKGNLTYNFFKAGIHWSQIIVLIFSFLFVQCIASAIDYFVSIWTKQERLRTANGSSSAVLSTQSCILIQLGLLSALLIFIVLRTLGYYVTVIRVARNIHYMMFNGVILTPMRFFDTNPSGRILNRFSRDLRSVDEMLPKHIFDASQNLLTVFGSVVVVSIANPYFIIPMMILVVFVILIRKVYLKTSQNLKRLEGIALSPNLTHVAVTLSDLSTVRAYQKQEILRREFDQLQDRQTACSYMAISTASTFGFLMDVLCTLFIACIVFYYTVLNTKEAGEIIGLSISQAIFMTGLLSWAARQSTDATNETVAVERVLEYRYLKPEKQPEKPIKIPAEWPSQGHIVFKNVYYRYFAEVEPVLRNLTFVIKPKEKIGVVGRTGAGKSSLIGALNRLGCVDGEVIIDGIDTAHILLSDLRKQIAIIPQDPVLFSGTLRKNLDPFEEHSDSEIWNALNGVELKSTVSESFGLQSAVLPHGSNFSVGQRQLLCLARAILRKNRILVIDEATANVDPHTDSLIQHTIRDKFSECTVLTVAHRLNTIIDYNRVMVMDAGQIAEFDKPYILFRKKESIFYGMVRAADDRELEQHLETLGQI